ncbi:hypothetical protein DFH07DRAFT_868822 [Mycena maculata]|uniref:Uncharacterized protein n=1 Tax=Mycena maculata TaxID=230809 RepID=A0AAD7J1E3_9AGAR|nr:hypothetical protein DFH07DRAFT_868822 [Mycena maculata]
MWFKRWSQLSFRRRGSLFVVGIHLGGMFGAYNCLVTTTTTATARTTATFFSGGGHDEGRRNGDGRRQGMATETSERHINTALDLWAASVTQFGATAPWKNAAELYSVIDTIQARDMPWKTYEMRYMGDLPPGKPPKWMTQTYEVCTCNLCDVLHHQLESTGFKDQVDMVAYRQFNHDGHRDLIAADSSNHGCAFVPIVAGSDKTTVSITTGHQEYHPVYASPGNLTGPARRALHGNGVLPVAFLAIPKTSKRHRATPAYQKFCQQMYHASLALIYQPLKAFMDSPEIVRCPDGHLCRIIYGIGPYIADYPEQVWLATIVQKNWCPKCDAHPDHLDAEGARLRTRTKTETLITCFDPGIVWDDYGVRADIVVIKGTFKDHIVSWVNEYLLLAHREKLSREIIQDIDRRLSAVPEFPGLRRFLDGHDFNQWTGDNSKALMKIYLSAVAGYLPSDMVKCLSSFMEFCYLVCRNAISTPDLAKIENVLARFHQYRVIFIECGVRTNISLPCQHSLIHYPRSIRLFGSPNGLCSSITESKHIKAIKEPRHRSSRFNTLKQMLVMLTRLDKLAALKAAFRVRGMLTGTASSCMAMVLAGEQPQVVAAKAAVVVDNEDDDDGTVRGSKSLSDIELAPTARYPKKLEALAGHICQPQFPELFRRFLHEELNGPPGDAPPVPLNVCPIFAGHITVHHSAITRFYAPSNLGGAGGMYRERIHSNPNWHGYPRRDTVLVDVGGPVMHGLVIGRVLMFFSFSFVDRLFQCVLVNWLVPVGDAPDPDTGMWVVELERERNSPTFAIINVNAIAHASHLIGVYSTTTLPEDFHFSDALDAFNTYFVNLYADHHMHEFLT